MRSRGSRLGFCKGFSLGCDPSRPGGLLAEFVACGPKAAGIVYTQGFGQNRCENPWLSPSTTGQPTKTNHQPPPPTSHRWGLPMENLQPQHDCDGRTIAPAAGFSRICPYGLYSLYRQIQAIFRLGLRSAIVVPFAGAACVTDKPFLRGFVFLVE